MDDFLKEEEAKAAGEKLQTLKVELQSAIFGQEELIDTVIVGLLAGGHVLLEGLPGLGKTELVKSLGKAIDLDVKRVQFTPDLLPGDITGNPILREGPEGHHFVFQKGPVFTNLLLADEINRASPKTQAALLEAMQESSVTVMGETHALPKPFFVLATQNPIDLEGTYPLPEAQLDRFLFKVEVHKNTSEVLERIVNEREMGVEPKVSSVLTKEELIKFMQQARSVYLPPVVANYIARLVDATHEIGKSEGVKFGASPRAALGLAAAIKSRSLLEGRPNASFEDVEAMAIPVLRHRLLLEYSAKLEGKTTADVVQAILKQVPVQDREMPSTVVAT